jgi:hypothetical protein
MKKVFFVFVLLVAALVVNAQQDTVKTTKTKSTTTTTVAPQQAVRASVKVAELLKPITDNVAKDYAEYIIKEATSVTLNNVVTYEIVISKGTATETLLYDKDGKFIKKMEL